MALDARPPLMQTELDSLYYADEPEEPPLPCKRVPSGDVYEAARAGDVERLKFLLEQGVNVNARDTWDSVALYYACLAGHLDAARMLMESGAICSEHTFDGDRCHYAALNLRVRKLLKAFEARPPPLEPLPKSLRELFLGSMTNLRYFEGSSRGNHGEASEECTSSTTQNGRLQSILGFTSEVFGTDFSPDITFFVTGQPIEAHRAILAARSPYFKRKFEKEWKHRKEIRFANRKLTYPALFSLIQFFYTDRLDVAVDDMEDLARICKVCRCVGLQKAVQKELVHQKFAEYKHLRDADDSQKRFILQGSSLPEEERLPASLRQLLSLSLVRSNNGFAIKTMNISYRGTQVSGMGVRGDDLGSYTSANLEQTEGYLLEKVKTRNRGLLSQPNGKLEQTVARSVIETLVKREEHISGVKIGVANLENNVRSIQLQAGPDALSNADRDEALDDDHADVCFVVEGQYFRSHQVILAARSEYFRTRFSRMNGFREGSFGAIKTNSWSLPVLKEQDLGAETFKKLLEYLYTDQVTELDPNQAEEMFDAASRYLLFPLKRAVADALLPQLETATPADLCHWLQLADMYGVSKLREHCLDAMAVNFEVFAATMEFQRMLLVLPPPSGDFSERTSAPSAPGGEGRSNQGNLLDDLREKWLAVEGAELDQRDESARLFDKRLELLVLVAENEGLEDIESFQSVVDDQRGRDIMLDQDIMHN